MNATQLTGIVAFGAAALLCFRARWVQIGAINAVFAIECVFGLRHRIHDLAVQLMGPLYAERGGVQIVLIGLALALLAGSGILLLLSKHRLVPANVTAATLLAVALFSIEVISLHAIDAVLYRYVGDVMVIGWLWLALALVIAIGALRAKSRKGG